MRDLNNTSNCHGHCNKHTTMYFYSFLILMPSSIGWWQPNNTWSSPVIGASRNGHILVPNAFRPQCFIFRSTFTSSRRLFSEIPIYKSCFMYIEAMCVHFKKKNLFSVFSLSRLWGCAFLSRGSTSLALHTTAQLALQLTRCHSGLLWFPIPSPCAAARHTLRCPLSYLRY